MHDRDSLHHLVDAARLQGSFSVSFSKTKFLTSVWPYKVKAQWERLLYHTMSVRDRRLYIMEGVNRGM